jgi:hypothetical protein
VTTAPCLYLACNHFIRDSNPGSIKTNGQVLVELLPDKWPVLTISELD